MAEHGDTDRVRCDGGAALGDSTDAECGQKRLRSDESADQNAQDAHRPATRPCTDLVQAEGCRAGRAPSAATSAALRCTSSRRLGSLACARADFFVVRAAGHAAAVLCGLHALYDERSLCDVTVRVDGEDFRAHRVVLAASSDFLRCFSDPCLLFSAFSVFRVAARLPPQQGQTG